MNSTDQPYEYTHLTWRGQNAEGTITTYVHVIPDRERAADEIRELAMNPRVSSLRVIQYPQPVSEDRIARCTCRARDAGYAHTEMHTAACAVSVTPSA